jgi:hypothetical protein
MFSFLEMEERAFELGRLMAIDGYPFDANPYIGLNPRLEQLWNQAHGKMHSLHRMAQKRAQAVPVRAVPAGATAEAAAGPRPVRHKPQLRIVR